jgi:hypothetical protein
MEDHPGFCLPGKHLHDLNCGGPGCERTFAPTLKEVKHLGKDKASPPAADKPVCCCVNTDKGAGANRHHECKHALCNPCWTKAALGGHTRQKAFHVESHSELCGDMHLQRRRKRARRKRICVGS